MKSAGRSITGKKRPKLLEVLSRGFDLKKAAPGGTDIYIMGLVGSAHWEKNYSNRKNKWGFPNLKKTTEQKKTWAEIGTVGVVQKRTTQKKT